MRMIYFPSSYCSTNNKIFPKGWFRDTFGIQFSANNRHTISGKATERREGILLRKRRFIRGQSVNNYYIFFIPWTRMIDWYAVVTAVHPIFSFFHGESRSEIMIFIETQILMVMRG